MQVFISQWTEMDCIRMPELVFQLLLRCHFSVIVRGCLSLFLLSVAYKEWFTCEVHQAFMTVICS
jgi:hypothetical protein